MEFQRREIHFSGRVQGVGFRYSTMRIASNYEVTGFVRNLPDGRVHVVAEGRKSELDAFIRQIQETMETNISSLESTIHTHRGEFDGFHIER